MNSERIYTNRDHPHNLIGELEAIYWYINFLQLEILNHLSLEDAEKIENRLESTIKDKLKKPDERTMYDLGFRTGLKTLLEKPT